MVLNLLRHHHHDKYIYVLVTVYSQQYQLDEVRWGPRSTSCYLNPGLLYTMHTLKFHMILMHDQQNPLTTSNYYCMHQNLHATFNMQKSMKLRYLRGT